MPVRQHPFLSTYLHVTEFCAAIFFFFLKQKKVAVSQDTHRRVRKQKTVKIPLFKTPVIADPCGRAVKGLCLRPLDCCDRGFESL